MSTQGKINWEKIIQIGIPMITMLVGYYGSYLTNKLSVDSKIETLNSNIQTVNTTLNKFDDRFTKVEDSLKQILLVNEKSTTRLDYLEMRVSTLEQQLNNKK